MISLMMKKDYYIISKTNGDVMRIETMEEALEMIDYLVKEIEFRDRIIQRLSKELREC